MSIHAKSLNQLAEELEGLQKEGIAYCPPLAASAQLIELRKKCDANLAAANELASTRYALQPYAMNSSSQTNSTMQGEVRPFFMDSTLGTRYRATELVTMSNSEISVPLYAGFTSTGEISEITKKYT